MNKYYYRSKQPNIFEMLIEIIAAVMLLIGKLIFKIFRMIFNNHPKMKLSLQQKDTSLSSPLSLDDVPAPVQVSTESKYTLKRSLLTDAEKDFLKILEQVVGNAYHIESQVPLP